MFESKLILVEGIPGSGKSTMAQSISRTLRQHGISHRWWYEEEKAHPLYIFDNYNSINDILAELNNGNYRLIIQKALDKWREFSLKVRASYPSLIYFYQSNIRASLERICTRRGGNTQNRFIHTVEESIYGKLNSLSGFDGMVEYWKAYREIIDSAFSHFAIRKIAIENTEADWSQYIKEAYRFLDMADKKLHEYADNQERDGLPHMWPYTPIILVSDLVFDVESLPFQVYFEEDPVSHDIIRFYVHAPELLDGHTKGIYVRVREKRI